VGHHVAEQLGGFAVDRQLVFQLGDPFADRDQLGVVAAGYARQLAAVDRLLPPPVVNRLRADLQVVRDLRCRPPDATRSRTLRRNSGA
jgi:hypothetical protein